MIASVGPPAVSQTSTENLKAHSGGSFANSATIEPFRALNWSAAIFAATAHCLDWMSRFANGSHRLARKSMQSLGHWPSQAVVGLAHEIVAARTPTRARRVIILSLDSRGRLLMGQWSFSLDSRSRETSYGPVEFQQHRRFGDRCAAPSRAQAMSGNTCDTGPSRLARCVA